MSNNFSWPLIGESVPPHGQSRQRIRIVQLLIPLFAILIFGLMAWAMIELFPDVAIALYEEHVWPYIRQGLDRALQE